MYQFPTNIQNVPNSSNLQSIDDSNVLKSVHSNSNVADPISDSLLDLNRNKIKTLPRNPLLDSSLRKNYDPHRYPDTVKDITLDTSQFQHSLNLTHPKTDISQIKLPVNTTYSQNPKTINKIISVPSLNQSSKYNFSVPEVQPISNSTDLIYNPKDLIYKQKNQDLILQSNLINSNQIIKPITAQYNKKQLNNNMISFEYHTLSSNNNIVSSPHMGDNIPIKRLARSNPIIRQIQLPPPTVSVQYSTPCNPSDKYKIVSETTCCSQTPHKLACQMCLVRSGPGCPYCNKNDTNIGYLNIQNTKTQENNMMVEMINAISLEARRIATYLHPFLDDNYYDQLAKDYKENPIQAESIYNLAADDVDQNGPLYGNLSYILKDFSEGNYYIPNYKY